MNQNLEALSTKELQTELERRRMEEMTKEELIEALREAKKEGSWADQTHQNLLQLADRFGVDVNEALAVDKVGLVVLTGAFYCLAAAVAIFPVWGFWHDWYYDRLSPSTIPFPLDWIFALGFLALIFWVPAYCIFWFARKNWKIHRGIYSGRNQV
ncbi:MAG: hypothetical protein A2600_09945 [Candidatus Lambdaproteobacteria bacterium RIFOXYD1_FULL_56_27]|uniref:Uncharacterized protein n=1 Tax=Candidatus Lambdaproteobacteria bacterium RIFOXYD2_FULL_56_26 TaxID=1817773 RepID=A0A1F6GUK3_9PROT|nr:MAG: hypothetical protein A2557_11745 [Candidatus Lambdaproteobacteria bacterium RIFOXYD2_FULL_56_26]OGH07401.1 MAG: hypothetical protein A2600_09945 [Candidatus Lambdaproteobacteria bacterium RIFOXYD1_FULL_56_27]